jgi:hypothetical protein
MTVNLNDLERLSVEIMNVDADTIAGGKTIEEWLSREGIEDEAFTSYLSMNVMSFMQACAELPDDDNPDDLAREILIKVGQAFRLGWEAQKQYGS